MPTSLPSGILIHPAIWPQQIWAANWVPIQHNVARAKAYLCAKFHLDLSNRFATIHQRHRQDRQIDNGPIAWGEPFYKRFPIKTRNVGQYPMWWPHCRI